MKKLLLIVFKRLLTVYVDFWKRFYMTMIVLHVCLFDAFMIFNIDYDVNYVKEHMKEVYPYAIGVWLFLVFFRFLLTPSPPQEVIIVEDRRRRRK